MTDEQLATVNITEQTMFHGDWNYTYFITLPRQPNTAAASVTPAASSRPSSAPRSA